MIFDKLCGAVERYPALIADPIIEGRIHPLENILRSAKLFVLPAASVDIIPSSHLPVDRGNKIGIDWNKLSPNGDQEFLWETFFLPYRTVAFEDLESCTVLIDTEENQIGLAGTRAFLECKLVSKRRAELIGEARKRSAEDVAEDVRLAGWMEEKYGRDPLLIYVGLISYNKVDGRICHHIEAPEITYIAGRSKSERIVVDDVGRPGFREALGDVSCSVAEVAHANLPSRFVVEVVAPRAANSVELPGRIRRSHERPVYTLMTPDEIKVIIQPPAPHGDRAAPIPHARRRHFRRLSAERYTNAKGKTVVVSACWVGPTEAMVDGKRYRICLDA